MLLAVVPVVLAIMVGVAISRSRKAARAAALRNAGQAAFVEAMEAGAEADTPAGRQTAYDRAADLALRHFGRVTRERARALVLAATAYDEEDAAEAGTARLEAALSIERKIGADPLALAETLAWLSRRHPNHDAAYRAASEALSLVRRTLGKADPRYLDLALSSAPVLARTGHAAEADALFRATLEAEQPEDPSLAVRARLDYAAFLDDHKRPDAAAKLRAEAKERAARA